VARAALHITAASPSWGSSGVCAVNAKDSPYNIYNELRACKAMNYADKAPPEVFLKIHNSFFKPADNGR
jgi:hypothetical protein